MTPIPYSAGTLLTAKCDIVQSWWKMFSQLLNKLQDILQRPVLSSFDDPPTLEETQKKKITSSRLRKHLFLMRYLPNDLKDTNAIHLYKNKDDRASCDSHRGISPLSISGNLMALIILSCITQDLLDDFVSESQCAFRRNRWTIDMIFAVGKIKENAASRIRACTSSLCPWPRPLIRSAGGLDMYLPKMVFLSEVASGTRNIGHPLKSFKEALKQKTESNPTLRRETFATDRTA